MKNVIALLSICIMFAGAAFGQSVLGIWETIDDETGLHKSDMEIFKGADGKLYSQIIEMYNRKPDDSDKCDECKGSDKDLLLRKQADGSNLKVVKGLEKDGDEWSGGTITDPKNGKVYKCYIELVDENKLKVRGYIGFSLLGRTQYWYRKGSGARPQ